MQKFAPSVGPLDACSVVVEDLVAPVGKGAAESLDLGDVVALTRDHRLVEEKGGFY